MTEEKAKASPVVRRIGPLPRDRWTDDAREVFAFWGEPGAWENGSRTNMQMVLANHPPLGLALGNFGKHILIENSAPGRARELVTLRLAFHMRSEYEWHYHVGYGLKLGMTLEEIGAVREGPDAAIWGELDAAVLRCVDELWHDSRISDDTWAVLAKNFSTPELMDLVFTCGQYVMIGWAIAAFGVQVEDDQDPIGFDLRTQSGRAPGERLKPGEDESWAEAEKSQ